MDKCTLTSPMALRNSLGHCTIRIASHPAPWRVAIWLLHHVFLQAGKRLLVKRGDGARRNLYGDLVPAPPGCPTAGSDIARPGRTIRRHPQLDTPATGHKMTDEPIDGSLQAARGGHPEADKEARSDLGP